MNEVGREEIHKIKSTFLWPLDIFLIVCPFWTQKNQQFYTESRKIIFLPFPTSLMMQNFAAFVKSRHEQWSLSWVTLLKQRKNFILNTSGVKWRKKEKFDPMAMYFDISLMFDIIKNKKGSYEMLLRILTNSLILPQIIFRQKKERKIQDIFALHPWHRCPFNIFPFLTTCYIK